MAMGVLFGLLCGVLVQATNAGRPASIDILANLDFLKCRTSKRNLQDYLTFCRTYSIAVLILYACVYKVWLLFSGTSPFICRAVVKFMQICRTVLQNQGQLANDVRIEYLIPIKQTESGVEFSLIPKSTGVGGHASESNVFETKIVHDQQLSPDCGDQFFRCKPLPVATLITLNDTVYQLLVPLNRGLLVMELRFSVKTSKMVFGPHRILDTHSGSTSCSPTTVFYLYDSYYTVCTNLQNTLVSLYEIRVNKTSIERTEISGPIVTVEGLDNFMSSDVVNMSDFLVSTDIPHQPLIYFAIDNYLFAIDPIDYSVAFDSGTTMCRYIHRLARVSRSQLLAYCSSEFVYFDTELHNWVNKHSYTDSGVPYLCPNETYGVNAFQNYLEYSIGSNTGTLSDINVGSGMCFNGTGGRSYFVYNDKVSDTTTLINLTSAERIQIPFCENLDCLPVIAIEDPVRYLIIRQPSGDGRVNVLDIEANFSTIISVDHKASDMFTVVHTKAPSYPSPGPPAPKGEFNTGLVGGIIGAIAFVVIIVIIITVVIIIVVGYFTMRYLKLRRHGEIHNAVPLPESQPVTVILNHNEVPQGQPQFQPVPVSPSGGRESSIQAGGTSNSSLRILGEEEKELYEHKQLDKDSTTLTPPVSMYSNYDNKKPSNIDPDPDSISLPTDSSINPVPETTENINKSIPIAATAADSDTGSEDSTMNSDKQPLLDN